MSTPPDTSKTDRRPLAEARRAAALAERFARLNKPGEALRRARAALDRLGRDAPRTRDAAELAQHLRHRVERYRDAALARARAATERLDAARAREII